MCRTAKCAMQRYETNKWEYPTQSMILSTRFSAEVITRPLSGWQNKQHLCLLHRESEEGQPHPCSNRRRRSRLTVSYRDWREVNMRSRMRDSRWHERAISL